MVYVIQVAVPQDGCLLHFLLHYRVLCFIGTFHIATYLVVLQHSYRQRGYSEEEPRSLQCHPSVRLPLLMEYLQPVTTKCNLSHHEL